MRRRYKRLKHGIISDQIFQCWASHEWQQQQQWKRLRCDESRDWCDVCRAYRTRISHTWGLWFFRACFESDLNFKNLYISSDSHSLRRRICMMEARKDSIWYEIFSQFSSLLAHPFPSCLNSSFSLVIYWLCLPLNHHFKTYVWKTDAAAGNRLIDREEAKYGRLFED